MLGRTYPTLRCLGAHRATPSRLGSADRSGQGWRTGASIKGPRNYTRTVRRVAPTIGPPSPSACGAQIQAWPLHISAKARSVPWEPGRVVRFQPRRKVHFVSEVADGAVLRAYLKSQAAPQSYFRSNLSVQAFAQPPPESRAAARYIPLRGKTNAVPTSRLRPRHVPLSSSPQATPWSRYCSAYGLRSTLTGGCPAIVEAGKLPPL